MVWRGLVNYYNDILIIASDINFKYHKHNQTISIKNNNRNRTDII
jgi:hypothetical protein